MNRQKVLEVEKLAQIVRELEEAVLAGGAAANAVCDYAHTARDEYKHVFLKLVPIIFKVDANLQNLV